jgi:2-polyprenyl-3-methyl-5-hydroxy-6-metoxy-1,4-benzoquinol methylase
MIKILLIILFLIVLDAIINRTIDRFSSDASSNTKYIMTDEEIYYPVVDNGNNLEYSRFNYITKEVKHKYAKAMMKQITKEHPKILVLGVALGGIIINILDKYPQSRVVGVDITDEYFDLVKKYSDTSRLELIKTDAEEYIANSIDSFDIIICDIFDGLSMPSFILSKPFLDKINKMILPKGKYMINTIHIDNMIMQQKLENSFPNKKINENKIKTRVNTVYTVNF